MLLYVPEFVDQMSTFKCCDESYSNRCVFVLFLDTSVSSPKQPPPPPLSSLILLTSTLPSLTLTQTLTTITIMTRRILKMITIV